MADFLENGDEFLTAYAANVERLRAAGADDIELERDGCGVGCVVAIDGKPRREVVVKGIEALKAVWHRGAVDADGKTGDGAGIHVQIPQDFFREQIKGAVDTDTKVAVGMVFLPRNSFAQQEACRTLVESEILRFGYAEDAKGFEIGENIAWASQSIATPRKMVSLWMNSPPHRRNILRNYTQIGIAQVRDSSGRLWVVQVFRVPG